MMNVMDKHIVEELIKEQFPEWAHLPVRAVHPGGIDNKTFRLGSRMLIRLPSAKGYAAQVEKEQEWLPKLAEHLSLQIPEPIAMGKPAENYPWNWSIYRWIEGESADTFDLDDRYLERLARDLAEFLKELQKIDSAGGPLGGLHNYYRGAHLSVYDEGTTSSIQSLRGLIDGDKATAVWEEAKSSRWYGQPVWVHGDVASGNLLIKDQKLAAVIDFGCMGVGDPSCDLVIAWTYFKGKSRKIFMDNMGLDSNTWNRARGWALWKACFELIETEDKTSKEALSRLQIINDVI